MQATHMDSYRHGWSDVWLAAQTRVDMNMIGCSGTFNTDKKGHVETVSTLGHGQRLENRV